MYIKEYIRQRKLFVERKALGRCRVGNWFESWPDPGYYKIRYKMIINYMLDINRKKIYIWECLSPN